MPIDIPSSHVPHISTLPANSDSSHDYLLSRTPKSASDKNNEGHLILLQKSLDINNPTYLNVATTPAQPNQISSLETSHDTLASQEPCESDDCGLNKTHLLPDPHKSYNMNEETLRRYTDFSMTERTQEQENQLQDSNTHLSLENYDDFLLLSFVKLDDGHYRKLAKFMIIVCNGLVTVSIPDYCNKINQIKQMLESAIKIYDDESEGSTEKANEDVQLQYKVLKEMLENLSLSVPLCSIIYIDGILKDMQFQYCVIGPYSPYDLVQAINKTNRSAISTAPSPSKCSIM